MGVIRLIEVGEEPISGLGWSTIRLLVSMRAATFTPTW